MSSGAGRLGDGGKEPSLLAEILTAVGFFAMSGALLIGHRSPAQGYELSIYTSTPLQFWIGVGIAAVVGISLSFSRRSSSTIRVFGYCLTAGSVTGIASIPVIRGYHFFGPGDSLTHLGWARDIATGQMNSLDLLYPGIHSLSVLVAKLSGLSLEYSVELVVIIFLIPFFVFVPLVVRYLADGWWAIPVGILAAALFVPINNVSIFRMAHPATQTILLVPFVTYLLLTHLDSSGELRSGFRRRPIGTDVLLATAGMAVVYLHPQIALSLISVLVAMSMLQLLARVGWPQTVIANHRLLISHTLFIGGVFLLWAPNHRRTRHASAAIVQSFIQFFSGTTAPADGAANRGTSLVDIGASIEVLFLKLFGVSLILSIIAGALILLTLYRRWNGSRPTTDTYILYLTAGFAALLVGFFVYFLSSVTTQYFRQLGFIMVFVTLIGAAGISRMVAAGPRWLPDDTVLGFTVTEPSELALGGVKLLFIILLVASLPTLYRSPYIYQASDHVPESHADGIEATFDRMDRDVQLMGIRHGAGRYQDGIYGFNRARSSNITAQAVPPPVFNDGNYTAYYTESRYLLVTERDVKRETVVFKGLRYNREGATQLEDHHRLHRVVSNGEVRVYYISDPPEASNATE